MGTVDPTFGLNDFNKPKVLTELQTKVNNILTILFGVPGSIPSLPLIGMNVKKYLYMFEDEINTDEIKSNLASQCSDFLPDIKNGDLDVTTAVRNNKIHLVFKLPIIESDNNSSVILVITTNPKGEVVFNYAEMDATNEI